MAKPIRHRRDVMSENRSDDVIVCKVCLMCYDEDESRLPLLLHCRHTFCGLCIADCLTRPEDRSVVLCPLCKVRTVLQRKGLAGLQVNQTSLEAVRKLLKEKQSQMGRGVASAKHRPSADTCSQKTDFPVNSAKPASQLKGILKVRPKQALLSRHEVLRHDLRYSPDRNYSQNQNENGDDEKFSEVHRIIVKSVDHLHPPPKHSNLDSAVQSSATDVSAGDATEGDSTNGLDISSEVGFRFPEEEEENVTSHPSAILNSLSPDFIGPLSPPESNDRQPIIGDIDRGPLRMDGESSSEDSGGRGRLYPLTALLSMASAEGVPIDQMTSAGPQITSELSQLTETQRRLPSNAKYVGRFGNYSAIRQPGSLQRPQGLTVSADGSRLAIVDVQSQGVHVYSSKGEFVHFFAVLNATGCIAFLVDDHLAVATAAGVVHVHLLNGVHRKSIPVSGASGPSGTSGASGVLAVAPLKQGFVAASRNRLSVCRSLVSPVVHSINGKRDAQLASKLIPFEEIVDVAVNSRGELCILEAKVVFVTDEDGVILASIRPTEDSPCGPIGRGDALASCPSDDRGIVVVDDGLKRVLLFGPEGQFVSCLLNFHDGFSSDVNIRGVVVTKSKKLFLVLIGDKMAEVRAYTF